MDDFRISYDLENNRVIFNREPVCFEEYNALRYAITDMTARWLLVEAAKKAEKEKKNPLSVENIRRALHRLQHPQARPKQIDQIHYTSTCKYAFCNNCGHIYKREDLRCDRCGHTPFTVHSVEMS